MKTIFFDFGNVIGFFSHRVVSERLAALAGIPVDQVHGQLWHNQLEDDYESGRISTRTVLEHVRSRCRQLRCSDQELSAAFADMFWPNPEVCALVPRLKPRYRLVLASNTNELHSKQFRRQFADVLAHFDHLVLSHEVGTRKPEMDFYRHCQQHAHAQPHECLFIDDMPANIAAARAHGWHAILYQPNDDLHGQLSRILGIPTSSLR
jgi:HAD superfamily hydrolase (TIGR01549 family)